MEKNTIIEEVELQRKDKIKQRKEWEALYVPPRYNKLRKQLNAIASNYKGDTESVVVDGMNSYKEMFDIIHATDIDGKRFDSKSDRFHDTGRCDKFHGEEIPYLNINKRSMIKKLTKACLERAASQQQENIASK